MGRQVKCPYCERKLDKDESYEYKKRYYHVECFEEWNQEKTHREELLSYVCNLYKMDAPTGMMLKQIKDFQTDYKYKLKGMELALRYFHDTLGNSVVEGAGIGIIPFVYEDAKKHYIQLSKVEESVENTTPKKTRVVEVQSPTFNYTSKIHKIDITSL
ncbi:hypothetical protein LCM23_13070 [Cytobacillus kochii]|uniref:hypothetical protein n=1 Tax=Cytobacillus kochii TaxID=859143 RepID=UPI001CD56972|nr:hypothetical protein [Cytobacillus kochii]MCA1027026.1 hypothetical protein [Cytobacillus kochii]